ncbi:universal stress protein [Aquimarina brevivitae]|uniref:Nucleotide-binding universal stress UspA family protein n=1 Tax=Aquimarina brevivitae TaxID=323412 RepID=A0A4Q7PG95_9FLAO|nr:universal stress protein [Aquimarina brevivitae]RZS99524.1 nucleotide-binding universal stress UspA family protein [Aquimarina brevivitae]
MKNILVPLGLSEDNVSRSRLQYCIQLIKETGGKIFVVKEFKQLPRTGSLPTANKTLREITIAEIQKEIAKVEAYGVTIEALPIEGELLEEIPAFNLENSIDMLVLGAESTDISNPYFLNETAGSLVKMTEIPVLIVPENYEYKKIDKVLMAVKSGVIKKNNALSPVQEILSTFGADLKLLLVKTNSYLPEYSKIDEELKEVVDTYKSTENATLFQGLLEHLNENNPDLVCVFRRKRGFFEKLWEDNTVLKKDFESRVPLLVLRGSD